MVRRNSPIVVVEDAGTIVFYRPRECYAGIAETSVYVARSHRRRGAGRLALEAPIVAAKDAGYSKLLSRIFPEIPPALGLVRSLGLREVGVYEKHSQLDGEWCDVVIVERLLQ